MLNPNYKFSVLMIMSLTYMTSLFSQEINGTYINSDEKISINDSLISYELIAWGCCIHTHYSGKGIMHIDKNRLFINPTSFEIPIKSRIEKIIPDDSDTMKICNMSTEPYPFWIFFYKKNKLIFQVQSDLNGIGKVARTELTKFDSISISNIGVKPTGINLYKTDGYDLAVYLAINDENYQHYEFITNKGKGIKIKANSDKIYLKYHKRMKRHSKRQKYKWHRFDRTQ